VPRGGATSRGWGAPAAVAVKDAKDGEIRRRARRKGRVLRAAGGEVGNLRRALTGWQGARARHGAGRARGGEGATRLVLLAAPALAALVGEDDRGELGRAQAAASASRATPHRRGRLDRRLAHAGEGGSGRRRQRAAASPPVE